MAAELSVLAIRYPDRHAALRAFTVDGPRLMLFAPTAVAVAPGAPCEVAVLIGEDTTPTRLRGQVAARSAEIIGRQGGTGLLLSFHGADKAAAARFYATCAGRPASWGTATEERFEVRHACRVRAGERRLRGQILNVSVHGALLGMGENRSLRPGQEIVVGVCSWLPWLVSRRLRARVVWSGAVRGMYGAGVRFFEPYPLQEDDRLSPDPRRSLPARARRSTRSVRRHPRRRRAGRGALRTALRRSRGLRARARSPRPPPRARLSAGPG